MVEIFFKNEMLFCNKNEWNKKLFIFSFQVTPTTNTEVMK